MVAHNATGDHCPVHWKDSDVVWQEFCPNQGIAWLFTILFLITLVAHIAQGIIHRKSYSWVVCMGASWEFGSLAFRIISIKNPTNHNDYLIQAVLQLVAPIWINAYIYMVFGRMVFNFTADARIAKIKAWRFGLYFVGLDIFAFLVQFFAAISSNGKNMSKDKVLQAIHIYMAGIGFQQACIIAFTVLVVKFHLLQRHKASSPRQTRCTTLTYTLYVVLLLITVRIIFRLAEFANGYKSTIPRHEVYQFVLDDLPMFIALAVLNVFHPGRLMPGRESDFPPRGQRSNWSGHRNNKDDSLIPSAANMGSYVPMGGLSGRSSPDNNPPYNGPFQPQPVYPAASPYGQAQGYGAGDAERYDQRGRKQHKQDYGYLGGCTGPGC